MQLFYCVSTEPKSHLCAYHDLFAFPLLLPADGKTRGSRVPRMTRVQSEDHEAICLFVHVCLHRVFFLCANNRAAQTAHPQTQ